MPIYEYQCNACGHKLEALQKISDAPRVNCPKCEQPELKKLVSAAGFRLKGGGWYETDFKGSKGQKNLAGDASKGKKSEQSDSGSTKKSDNKSASSST